MEKKTNYSNMLKNILLYLSGFLIISICVFLFFFVQQIPNQFDTDVRLHDGKGSVRTERTIFSPFICIQTFGMGEGYHEFYCSLPELFITTIWVYPRTLIMVSLWIMYLPLGPFIFFLKN